MPAFILIRRSAPHRPYIGTVDTIEELLAFMDEHGPVMVCRFNAFDQPVLVIEDVGVDRNLADPRAQCACAEPQTLDEANCIRCGGTLTKA